MFRTLATAALALAALGCVAPTSADDTAGEDTVDTSVADTDTAPADTDEGVAVLAPDFSLLDVNPASPTGGDPVSPRDYLQKVSGWYVTHAT